MLLHSMFNIKPFILSKPIYICFLFLLVPLLGSFFIILAHKKKHVLENWMWGKLTHWMEVINTFQDFSSTCGILWLKIKKNGGTNVEINGCDWKALKKLFKLCIFVFLIHGSNKSFQRKLIVNYLKPNFKIKCNKVKVSLGGTTKNHHKEWKRNQK
jgi:hypothetical protein